MKKICSLMIPLSLGIYLSSSTSLNASIQWLPDALEEGLKFDGHSFPRDDYHGIRKLNCDDYKLSSCPNHGICDKCVYNSSKYKITGCKSPYILRNNACSCPTATNLGQYDKCIQECDGKCIAAKCVAPEHTKNCTHGTKICADGCGSDSVHKRTRTCCQDCPAVFTGTLPDNAEYTYTDCVDEAHPRGMSIRSGWKCLAGYDLRIAGDAGKCVACGSNFNLTACPPYGICRECGGMVALISCEEGYTPMGNRCQSNQFSLGSDVPTNPNTDLTGNKNCTDVAVPANATPLKTQCKTNFTQTYIYDWTCNDGYEKSGNSCIKSEQECSDYTLSSCPSNGKCDQCGGKYKLTGCVGNYSKSENKCVIDCSGGRDTLLHSCRINSHVGLCNGNKVQVGDKYYSAVVVNSSSGPYSNLSDPCTTINSEASEIDSLVGSPVDVLKGYTLPTEDILKGILNDTAAYKASGLPDNAGAIRTKVSGKYCEKGKGCFSSSNTNVNYTLCVREVCPQAIGVKCSDGYALYISNRTGCTNLKTETKGNIIVRATCYKCEDSSSSSGSGNNTSTREWKLSANVSYRGTCNNRSDYNISARFTSLDGTTTISEAHLVIVSNLSAEGTNAKRIIEFNKPIPDNQKMRLYLKEYWSTGSCSVGGLQDTPRILVNGEEVGFTTDYYEITPKPWRDAEIQFTLVFGDR